MKMVSRREEIHLYGRLLQVFMSFSNVLRAAFGYREKISEPGNAWFYQDASLIRMDSPLPLL
ncbi:hypothetical protein [Thiolapillus sp.]